MSVKIKPAFLAIVFLASPLSLAADAASAAESCLTAPGKPGPQGSRWYYRLEFPSKRKCWHLVLKDGKPQATARVTKPATEDEAEPSAAPAPAAPAPAERSAEAKPAPEPVIRTLVTRNASNPGAIVPPPDQPSGTAAADESANASAPAEQAAANAPAPAPVVEAAPQRAAVAPAQAVSDTGSMSTMGWLLAAVALFGSVACAVFIVVEVRRRRTDVLNTMRDDDSLPLEASRDEPGAWQADATTFAPLPAMRAMPIEDDVDQALRRFAKRRAA